MSDTQVRSQGDDPETLSPIQHLACGWPLLLIFDGAVTGGLCSGIAYGVNIEMFKSDATPTNKDLHTALIGSTPSAR